MGNSHISKSADEHSSHHGRHKLGHKHGEHVSIDFYAYDSKIRNWNPAFKVSFSTLVLVLCVVLSNPFVSITVIVAMAYLTVIKGGLPISSYLSILSIPITFILIGTVTIAVNFSIQPVGQFHLNLGFCYIFTSWADIKKMIFLIFKVFGAVSAMEMMALSTPSAEIIGVLRKAHVPKLVIELMNMIYRYIFILIDVNINMRNSADSRLGFYDTRTSWSSFGKIAGNMLIVSMKKADAFYNALEARCYDGEFMVLEVNESIKVKQIAGAAIFVGFLFFLWTITR